MLDTDLHVVLVSWSIFHDLVVNSYILKSLLSLMYFYLLEEHYTSLENNLISCRSI